MAESTDRLDKSFIAAEGARRDAQYQATGTECGIQKIGSAERDMGVTMMDLIHLFALGMKRDVKPFFIGWKGLVLNLGPGESEIPGTVGLDFPKWNGETDPIPFEDGTVSTVLGFHFLEHLTTEGVVNVLRETERVLTADGTAIFVVPHASQDLALQDIDHRTFWTEESMRTLLANRYYTKMRPRPWKLVVDTCLMMAVNVRNLSIFFQLRRM